jgi:uncharacterized protein
MPDRQTLLLEVPAMRIDVTQLLREPIGTQLRVEFNLGFQRLSDDLSVQAVEGQVRLLRMDEGIWAQGDLHVDVSLECGRCLNPVVQTIDIELNERFQLPPLKGNESDLVYAIDADRHLDLRPVLRDLVIVSTPMHILCRPDCLGLCPNCGKNLNEGPCDCQPDDIDPRLVVLKALLK